MIDKSNVEVYLFMFLLAKRAEIEYSFLVWKGGPVGRAFWLLRKISLQNRSSRGWRLKYIWRRRQLRRECRVLSGFFSMAGCSRWFGRGNLERSAAPLARPDKVVVEYDVVVG